MKKIIKSLILSSMLLIGCGGNVSTGNTNSNNSSSTISFDSSSTNNIKDSNVDSNSTSSASQNKKEVLRYSSYSIFIFSFVPLFSQYLPPSPRAMNSSKGVRTNVHNVSNT